MKFVTVKVILLLLLLGGDYVLETAPLGAFLPAIGPDGRVNLLFAPNTTQRQSQSLQMGNLRYRNTCCPGLPLAGTGLSLVLMLVLMICKYVKQATDLDKPIHILLGEKFDIITTNLMKVEPKTLTNNLMVKSLEIRRKIWQHLKKYVFTIVMILLLSSNSESHWKLAVSSCIDEHTLSHNPSSYKPASNQMQMHCASLQASNDMLIGNNKANLSEPTTAVNVTETVTVFVRNVNGNVSVFNCVHDIQDLKSQIYSKTGIPPEKQRLYFSGRQLTMDAMKNDININLIIDEGLKGGGTNCDICYDNGQYKCNECDKIFCSECCTKFHKHPERSNHNPFSISPPHESSSLNPIDTVNRATKASTLESKNEFQDESFNIDSDDDLFSDNFDISDSPDSSKTFQEASMIMTLAERFNLTRFKDYQKNAITALLSGKDCLIVQPTGSGKSLCFKFPAIHDNKKSLVITPTISLMQDQVNICDEQGIKAAYLGSAQLDLGLEERVLSPDNDVNIIFVTPEWISRADKKAKIQNLVSNNKLCMIAVDEAHLYHHWQEFRVAYKQLEYLKEEFPSVPIACLTATAPPTVKESLLKLLRDPFVTTGSINRENIALACEAIPMNTPRKDFTYFASRVSDILGPESSDSAIIYADFIDDVGPIMSKLAENGIESVAYYGEMDVKINQEEKVI